MLATPPARFIGLLTLTLLVPACGGGGATDAGDDGSGETAGSTGTETGTDTGTDTGDETETGTDTDVDPDACWTDLSFGEQQVFYQGFADGSEGITFGADGLLYVTTREPGEGTIWRLDADANLSEFAKVPYALGLAARPEGGFVVASFGINNQPDGGVYAVTADGVASELTDGIDNANFIALVADGSALVSDASDTRVFRVTPAGELSVVIEQVPSPNGMAYSPARDYFYVASTFTPVGQLTRFEVDSAGLPIEASAVEILQLGPATTPDGLAVDAEGMVYVAATIPGQVWRVRGDAEAVESGELVAEGLGSPASLAFGRGPGFDPCSIYVTQLFGNQIIRVAIGTPGAEL
jgi:gluconolactonase